MRTQQTQESFFGGAWPKAPFCRLLGARCLLVSVAIGGFLFTSAKSANASLLTAASVDNIEALDEATTMSDSILFQTFGFSPEQLTLNGNVGASGFSFTLNGNFSNMPVHLAVNGAFDAASGQESFFGSGTVGVLPLSESGMYTFNNSVPSNITYTGGLSAILHGEPQHDEEIVGEERIDEMDNGRNSVAVDVSTVEDTPSGRRHEKESFVGASDSSGKGSMKVNSDDISYTGNVDFSSGSVSGQLTSVPEPGSGLLLASSLAVGLLLLCRRKQRG